MSKDKGKEVEQDVADKVTEYVYKNYKRFKDKTLIIRDQGSHFTILHHITGAPLFLGKSILTAK